MYTPLQVAALNLHQQITDKIYRYRSIINWDPVARKWFVESSSFTSLWTWKFLNFVLIPFGVSTCAFMFLDALHNPGKYKLLILFFVSIEFMLGITSIATCLVFLNYAPELVLAANAMRQMLSQLIKDSATFSHSSLYRNKEAAKKPKQKIWKAKSSLCANPKFDYTASILIFLLVGLSVIPMLLPVTGIIFKWDAPYYVFKEFKISSSGRWFVDHTVLFIRILVAEFAVVEVCNTIRTFLMLFISWFEEIKICVSVLLKSSPRLTTWHTLRVIILVANESLSILLSLYLGVTFLLEIICVTLSVVAADRFSWYTYMFFPWIGLLVLFGIGIIFYQMVFIHTESKRVKHSWILFCTKNKGKILNLWNVKIKVRELKALQPIGFTYGSLGTVKRATRTDYYFSILQYSANAILASM